MKVRDLIEFLKHEDQEAEVYLAPTDSDGWPKVEFIKARTGSVYLLSDPPRPHPHLKTWDPQ